MFYWSASADERLRYRLEQHLSPLKQEQWIEQWHERLIPPGAERALEIAQAMKRASIILLLVSPDFLASPRCSPLEVQRVLRRAKHGGVRVIPVILRPCDWKTTPFARLECLPRGGKAVTEWQDQDAAFRDIVQGLRSIL